LINWLAVTRDVNNKTMGGRIFVPDLIRGAYSATPDPLADRMGAHCSSPKTPPPLL